jgi:hypothetical protein
MTKKEMDDDQYRIIKIQGKHGEINLMVPENKPTQEQLYDLHKVVADIIVKAARVQQKGKAKG